MLMDGIGKLGLQDYCKGNGQVDQVGMTKHLLKSSLVLRCRTKMSQHRLSMLMCKVDFSLLSHIVHE